MVARISSLPGTRKPLSRDRAAIESRKPLTRQGSLCVTANEPGRQEFRSRHFAYQDQLNISLEKSPALRHSVPTHQLNLHCAYPSRRITQFEQSNFFAPHCRWHRFLSTFYPLYLEALLNVVHGFSLSQLLLFVFALRASVWRGVMLADPMDKWNIAERL